MKALDKWFENKPGSKAISYETRKKAAAALGLTIDTLRTWERNGLYCIFKNTDRKMQFSEWDIEKLMVIRLLRNCGYSIASLLNVFGSGTNMEGKPSKLLSLKRNESEISHITDRYLEYLEDHMVRAEKIIDLLKEW